MANGGKVIVKIDGDTSGVEKEFKSAETSAKSTANKISDAYKKTSVQQKNSMKEVAESVKSNSKNASSSTKKDMSEIQTGFKQTEQSAKIAALKIAEAYKKTGMDSQEAFKKAWDEVKKGSDSSQKYISKKIKKIEDSAKTTADRFSEKFKDAFDKTKKYAGAAVKGIAVGFTATSAAITAGVGAAIKVGSDFEAQMSTVSAISGANAESMELLGAKAKEMGIKTAFSATEAGQAMEYMAMAGWKTEDMLNGVEGIMNLAAASGEDLAATSDIVTDAMTAFGLSADQSTRFADVLAAASSNANTNVGLMGETFKYVAPVAGAMGFSIEDTAVAIGLMANAGIKGSYAGTALRATLSRLAKPPKEAAEAMEALHLSVTNSDGSFKDFSQIISEMREKFGKLTDSQKTMYANMLGGQEAMSGLLAIVNASDSDFYKLTEAINTSAGSAERMANVRLDNFQGQITLLKSSLEGLGVAVYESNNTALTGAIEQVKEYVNQLTDAFNDGGFSGLIEQAGVIFGDIAAKIAEQTPKIIKEAENLLTAFFTTLKKNGNRIGDAAAEIVTNLATAVVKQIPQMLNAGISILSAFVDGLNRELPALMAFAKTAATAFTFLKIGTAVAKAQKALTAFTKTLTAAKLAQAAFSSDAIYKKVLNGKMAYSAITKSAQSMALAQAAVNGQITIGQTLIGVLTGKITLATLATALWTKAQAALNAVRMLDPIYLTITAVAALGVGIYAACKAYDSYIEKNNALVIETREMAEASQETKEKVSELSGTLQDLSNNAATSIESAEAEAYANKALADELYNLADQAELTNNEKERMKDIVDQLNGSVDGLNLKFDEEKGTLNLTRDAVEELITKKLELAKANAVSEMYTELLKNQYKAQTDAVGAAQKMADAQEKLADLEKKAAENPSYKNTKEYKKSYDNLTDTINNYESAIKKSREAVDDSFTDMKNLATVAGVQLPAAFDESIVKMNGFFDGMSDALGIADKEAVKHGDWFVSGYVDSLLSPKNMQAIYNAAYAEGQTAKKGLADGQKSHSPSKEAYKLGGFFGDGYVLGINDTAPEVEKAGKNIAETAIEATSKAISKSDLVEQIMNIGKDTRTEVQKVTDDMNAVILDSEKKYNEESLRIQKEKSKSKYEQSVLDAKAEYEQDLKKAKTSKQIADARAKYEKKLQKATNKATKEEQDRANEEYLDGLKKAAEAERKIYDALQKDIENQKNKIKTTFKELAESAMDSIQEIAKAQETLSDKLKNWGSLYTTDTYNIGGVKYSVVNLSDLNKQNEQLEEYADTLLRVKERGNVPAEFFKGLLELSPEEGLSFAKGLLTVSDAEFTEYIDAWNRKIEKSDTISKFAYADETQKATEEISKKFDDFNSDIEKKGKENAASWGEGFFEEIREIMPEIQSRIRDSISSIAPYGTIVPAMAGTNISNTSNVFNISSNSNETNTDTLTLYHRWTKLQEARGSY